MAKISQKEAKYVDISRKPKESCVICTMYRGTQPPTCSAVSGNIRQSGWCKLFERKRTLRRNV